MRQPNGAIKSFRLVVRRREWFDTDGITLHQTACNLGEKPERWLSIGCHFGVTRAGDVLWLHDCDWIVNHGNLLNTRDVGIEIDGAFEGIVGHPKTFWRPLGSNAKPQLPTEQQIASTSELLDFIAKRIADNGGKLKHIHAHRQGSPTRRSDPGSAVWRSIALPAMEKLGVDDGGPGWKLGAGRAIPESWDPSRKGSRY